MRTNIEIDDQLVSKAMRSSGARTKEGRRGSWSAFAGQNTFADSNSPVLRGKVQWQGDLNESRLGRSQE